MKSYYQAIIIILLSATSCTSQNVAFSVADPKNNSQSNISKVDIRGLVLTEGVYGNLINGQSYQQDALASFNGWQYIAYYDAERNVCIGRRKLGRNNWEIIRFKDYRFSHNSKGENDSHNTISLGLCPKDGTLHLAFDHHADDLHYRVSKIDILNKPESVKWDASLFTPVLNYLEAGKILSKVSYPRFLTTPAGDMLLGYRKGGSGGGNYFIGTYNGVSGKWNNLHEIISGRGDFSDPFNGTSRSRNAYINNLTYDDKGLLHISWCWREGVQGTGNRDICHIYSIDNGNTWYNYKKEKVADLVTGKVVDMFSPAIQLKELDRSWGMMNNGAQAIDHNGIVHIVMFHHKTKGELPVWVSINSGAYFHYYRDSKGVQKEMQLPASGNRPKLLADKHNSLYLVFVEKDQFDRTRKISGQLKVWKTTSNSKWMDWKPIYESEEEYFNEPLIDLNRWQKDQIISVMVQDKPAAISAVPAAIKVLEITIR